MSELHIIQNRPPICGSFDDRTLPLNDTHNILHDNNETQDCISDSPYEKSVERGESNEQDNANDTNGDWSETDQCQIWTHS